MNIESLNCRCCGGVLRVKSSLCECDYCGATNFISDVASRYINQLNRANKLRQEREFDNAARIYDVILSENAPTADILWLRTLCEYGIEYVPDPVTDKYFPTLHRINEESILTYPSYVEALSLADGEEKKKIKEEAEYINTIQNEYLHIAENESPYDVFICYKETDESTGEKTEDVGLSETLYNDLTKRGFKVFFAKETLKSKLSIDYEPYIFAALKSARAMIVLGTKAEYFMSVWVKNEWGRFLKLMQKDSDKQIFFACDDPEELPRAFATRQAQLLGSDDALKNLADNVERFLKKNYSPKIETEAEILYNRALSYVNSRNDLAAKPFIERLIKGYPDYPKGYWLRMLNSYKANPSIIMDLPLDLYSNPDYVKAVSLAAGSLKDEYNEIASICKNNLSHQEEFDKILEKKSEEYLINFDKTELGQKQNELVEKILRNADTVDLYNDKLRKSFGIGISLFTVGNFILLILLKIAGYSRGYGSFLCVTLCTLPIILAGLAVLLSYNPIVDIVTTAAVSIILIISVFVPSARASLVFISIAAPVAVYIITSRYESINIPGERRLKAGIEIYSALSDLKLLTENVNSDFNKTAKNLLKEYKEKNNVKSVIEINDKSFIKIKNKINDLYESARDEYTKYVGVSMPSVRDTYQKKESDLGMASIIVTLIPLVSILSPVLAIMDLVNDKYKERRHSLSFLSLFLNVFMILIFILLMLSNK